MDEFIIGIFVFTLFLVVWASLGHVIWLALSAIIRGVFGSKCAQCGRRHLGAICTSCARHRPADVKPSVHSDLAAAQRLLAFSKFHHWLDADQHSALEKLVLRLEARITGSARIDDKWFAETAEAIEGARHALTTAPANVPPAISPTAPVMATETPQQESATPVTVDRPKDALASGRPPQVEHALPSPPVSFSAQLFLRRLFHRRR